MAETAGAQDYKRHQIDRIYESASEVSHQLRRMADEVDRAVETAKKNEDSASVFQPTFMDLPHNIQHIVQWGIANSGMEQVTRMVREFVEARDAFQAIQATSIVERLREFKRVWEERPSNSEKIYSLAYMVGPDDARVEAEAVIDTDLLQEIIDLLPTKKEN